MRIRSIKPEFWDGWPGAEFLYTGPLLKWADVDRTAPPAADKRYVYFLYRGDDLLYIGKAWSVRYRFEKHARKAWWPDVTAYEVVALTGGDQWELETAISAQEKACIAEFVPMKNIAGPAYLPGRRLWVDGQNPHDQA